MALTIHDDIITSDHTRHTARAVPGVQDTWEVSWLPGFRMTRDSAMDGLILAEHSFGDTGPDGRMWFHIKHWAAELGLSESDLLTMTARGARQAQASNSAVRSDPEAAG